MVVVGPGHWSSGVSSRYSVGAGKASSGATKSATSGTIAGTY